MLGDLGYHVVEAESAEAALALVEDGLVPDLLVSDHLRPGLGGTELARLLKGRAPEMRVLIVSGYSELDDIAHDLRRLTKPFRQEELASALA